MHNPSWFLTSKFSQFFAEVLPINSSFFCIVAFRFMQASSRFLECSAILIDLSFSMVITSEIRSNLPLFYLPFQDVSFNLVFLVLVAEYFKSEWVLVFPSAGSGLHLLLAECLSLILLSCGSFLIDLRSP